MQIDTARKEIIFKALRSGTVPRMGLGTLAVGLDDFAPRIDQLLDLVASGEGMIQGVRGEYGHGKTFYKQWVAERARAKGFASSWVYLKNPTLKLSNEKALYAALISNLTTSSTPSEALREIISAWYYQLDRDVLADASIDRSDAQAVRARTIELARARLDHIAAQANPFAEALIQYRIALAAGQLDIARELVSWLSGQLATARIVDGPPRATKRSVLEIPNPLETLLRGLLALMRDAGYAGLVLILDEVTTVAELPAPERKKAFQQLHSLFDKIDAGVFPGLYVLFSGTPSFFDSPTKGVKEWPPLAKRLETHFGPHEEFNSKLLAQVQLPRYGDNRLVLLGQRVRDIYCQGHPQEARIRAKVSDGFIQGMSRAMVGALGNSAGVAPRLFLKSLVGHVLDLADDERFDPRVHFHLRIDDSELTAEERAARDAAQTSKPKGKATRPNDLQTLPE